MDQKGGTVFLLLVCYTVLATSENNKDKSNSQGIEPISRKLIKKCMQTEKQEPDIVQLATALGSDLSAVERNSDSTTTVLLSLVAKVLRYVLYDTPSSKLFNALEKMGSKPLNDTDLPTIIQRISKSNVLGATRCAAFAVLAKMAWNAVTNKENANMDSEKYDLLLVAAEKMKEYLPMRPKFPKDLSMENMKKLMKMLRKFTSMTERQGAQVFKWVKEYIIQKYLKCSTSDKCEKWNTTITMLAVNELGPLFNRMSASDVELFTEEGLCAFLKSDQFQPIMGSRKLNPSLSKKLLSKFERCPEFLRNLDKLGKLGCYYDPTKLTEEQRKELSETSQCSGREKFIAVQKLSNEDVVAMLKNPEVKLSRRQKRALVMHYLGERKCPKLSAEQLKDLQPAAEVVPRCILKNMMKHISCDLEELGDKSNNFAKTQIVTIVNKQCNQLKPTELMDLPDRLLHFLTVKRLKTVVVKSWYRVAKATWRQGQAIYLVKEMKSKVKNWFRNPGSLILGVTCDMIEDAKDEDVTDMSEGLTDAPHALSKVQAMCTARRLFTFLEKKRPKYFETINTNELNKISTALLIHLPPEKIKSLPASVCLGFLDKMENANLDTLPELSPSRSALMNRSVACLGKALSRVSFEEMNMLGPLLCEVPPSHLKLLKNEVLIECFRAMNSCVFIPEKHKKGLVKLVTEIFGNPSDWKESIMEDMGHLLLYDSTELRLPDEPWMIQSLRYLARKQRKQTDVIKKNLFKLVIALQESKSSSTPARRKREVDENGKGDGNDVSNVVPTTELIQQLVDKDTNTNSNDQWTPQQLKSMTLDTFKKTVDILSEVTSYSPEQLAVLCEKADEAWGDAQIMTESQVAQLGCIAQCFTNDKLMKMDFSQSSLEDIASCGWTDAQVSAVWKGAAKYNGLSAESLDASDMMELGRFICGLTSTEIQQLNSTAFTDVVASINKAGCSAEVAKHFKTHLVDVFGDPISWTEEEVADLGTFFVALNATEFSSLNSSVFPFLSEESIPLLPAAYFAKLTPDQLMALGPDNAAKVTSAQKAGMSDSQLSALNKVVEGSREQTQQTPQTQQGSSSQADQVKGTITNLLAFFMVGLVLL